MILKDGRWAAVPWQDALIVEDEALLLIDGVPMRLAGIGLTIWRAIADGIAPYRLTAHVIAVHGDHPEAVALVADAQAALLEAGAVVHSSPMSLAQVMAGESRDDSSPRPTDTSAAAPLTRRRTPSGAR